MPTKTIPLGAAFADPPVFRREPAELPATTLQTQTAVLHLVAMRACLLEVKLRTHAITQPQLRAELQRMRHLLDEAEGRP